ARQPEAPRAAPTQRPFAPPASGNRNYSGNRTARPALNLHQPIVRPRSNSSQGYNAPRGNSHTNNAPRMDMGRPRMTIPRSMPSAGGRHSGGGSRPHGFSGGHVSHGGAGHSSGHSSSGNHHH